MGLSTESLDGLRAARPDEGVERGDTPPAIRAVDALHEAAVAAHASDIHIEPSAGGGRIRQRVNGMLADAGTLPPALFAQVVSRVKLLAAMDITDKRQPQDGRYQIDVQARSIDARVSSVPTIAGEKLVIRLLDMHARIPSLESLGMNAASLERYRAMLHAPHGFIVVCGPTGSGKTTSLYASLAERNVDENNVCTVEDPVELRLPGVAQVQVHARAGVTFASALRAFLRQDPNVVMVGEMRDCETAGVALSAALSGQLVVTSLHANDAPRAIDRLVELGLKRPGIAAALSGIVAQRLIRTLCSNCRARSIVALAEAALLGIPAGASVYEPRGCARCSGTGYAGRTGIFEVFTVTDAIRDAIATGESSVALAQLAADAGYEPMLADGARSLLRGETGIAELRRVFGLGAHA